MKQEVSRLGKQRIEERKKSFARAKKLHGEYPKRTGKMVLGRDENGAAVETRSLADLRILADKWYVRLSFKKEDRQRLESLSLSELEQQLKEGKVPRTAVKLNTHIIAATRAVKHVREGYEQELEKTDRMLRGLDELNVAISKKKASVSDEEIDSLVAQLQQVDSELSRKHVAVKRLVGRQRLRKTIKMFEDAKALEKRGAQLARACAVFTSLRNRLGQWRDRQVAGIAEHNRQREYALRVERDNWLHAQLRRFAENPERLYEYEIYDSRKRAVLIRVKKMISEKAPKTSILRFIASKPNSELFRVPKRQREQAEEAIRMMEHGLQPKGGAKIDYLIGHYGWLWRHVKNGETAKARDKTDYLMLFIDANKPKYVLDELRKSPDSYLEPVIENLADAVGAFDAEHFDEAKQSFTEAAYALEKIISPRLSKA